MTDFSPEARLIILESQIMKIRSYLKMDEYFGPWIPPWQARCDIHDVPYTVSGICIACRNAEEAADAD